jgi:hypothetical protein
VILASVVKLLETFVKYKIELATEKFDKGNEDEEQNRW